MLLRFSAVVYFALFAMAPIAAAESADEPKSEALGVIADTVCQFFTSLAKRDVQGIQGVVAERLLVIEAAGDRATPHVVDPQKPEDLLPPEGNDDFANVRIADVEAAVSDSLPSVATASFTLVRPLDANTLAIYEQMLKDPPKELDEKLKKRLTQIVKDRALRPQMLAVLVLKRGEWKIACLTMPK